MNNNTGVQSLTIETSKSILTIEDIKKPVWFGDHNGGKLAIYHVQVNGLYSSELVTVVAIFTDEEGNDFVFTSEYDKTSGGFEKIASHICALVTIEYAKQKSKPASLYGPGTSTLQ